MIHDSLDQSDLTPREEASRVLSSAAILRSTEVAAIAPITSTSRQLAQLRPIENTKVLARRPIDDDIYTSPPIINQEWLKKYRRGEFEPEVIEPVPSLGEPIRVDEFFLWLDPVGKRIFYSLATPRLRSFSLMIQRNAAFEIVSGTAVLEVNAYPTETPVQLEKLRQAWGTQIVSRGMVKADYGLWALVPLNLRNLQGNLEMAAGHASKPPQLTTSLDQGRATFLIELTALGAQSWGDACQNQRGETIPGVCRLNTSFYAQLRNRTDIRQQELLIPLGTLLAPCGPSVVNVLNPQVSVDAKVVVDWHDALNTVALSWQPNNGAAPGTQVFKQDSTPLSIVLTSQNPNALAIDWQAQISFKAPTFPTITRSGKLSFRDTNTALVIHTSSWLKQYVISVIFLDDKGNVIPSSSSVGDLANRVMGMLKFRAPSYLGDRALDNVFEAVSQNIVKPYFPLPEGEAAELELTIAAFRQSKSDMKTRKLNQEETFVLVKVYADARLEFITNQSETTRADDDLEIMTLLETGDYGARPQIETKIPGFHPTSHGFHFANNFVNHPVPSVSTITTDGLCGGMSYAALDYYFNNLSIPPHAPADFPFSKGIPAEGGRFYNYLYQRQLDSFTLSNLAKFTAAAFQSDATVQTQTRYTELPLLQSQILAGKPVVLGLINPSGISGIANSHQVVAYGIDENPSTRVVTLYVYDCNEPNVEATLTVNPSLSPIVESNGDRWKGFFVEDYTPKLPAFMGSREETWSEDWTTDWTTLMPFILGGRTHYFGYKVKTGQATIDRIKANGHGVETVCSASNWSTGWTSFVAFQLNGSPHLFAYKIGSGEVFIGKINPTAAYGVDTVWGAPAGNWTTGWSSFIAFELNGQPHLLTYKVKTGDVFIGRIRTDGQGVDSVWSGTWTKGWTSFMPFIAKGQPHYLTYKVETGQVSIDRIRPNGQGVDTVWNGTWTKGWTSFMPFFVSGQTHYLAYKASNGQMSVDRLRPDLQDVEVVRGLAAGGWSKDWSAFVPFSIGGRPHYLTYKATTGQASFGLCIP